MAIKRRKNKRLTKLYILNILTPYYFLIKISSKKKVFIFLLRVLIVDYF